VLLITKQHSLLLTKTVAKERLFLKRILKCVKSETKNRHNLMLDFRACLEVSK